MAKRRPKVFSAVTAVKANVRARLGTPPPSTPIPDRETKAARRPEKHKQQLQAVLERAARAHEE